MALAMSPRLVEMLMQPGMDPAEYIAQILARPSWMNDAACLEHERSMFFPHRGDRTEPAKAVCSGCLVQRECLAYALDDETTEGIWGGTSRKQRRAIRAGRLSVDALLAS